MDAQDRHTAEQLARRNAQQHALDGKQPEPLDMCPECGRWRAPYLGAQILELVERVAELEAAIRAHADPDRWDPKTTDAALWAVLGDDR